MSRRRKKLPREECSAQITSLSFEGRGIAHINGKTTFIMGALAKEEVKFKYTKQKNNYDEGIVTHITKPSPQRQNPPCPHFILCGGCALQHMKTHIQIQHKENALLTLLEHHHIIPKNKLTPLSATTQGYRRKARLSVNYVPKKNKVIVGFRERQSRLVADLEYCAVLDPSVGTRIKDISDLIYQLDARADIPQIEVAVDDNDTAIIVRHMQPLYTGDLNKLIRFSEKNNLKLYLQPKGTDSIHLVFPKNADPFLYYCLPSHNVTLQFQPSQFIQVNAEINQQMILQAITLLDIKPHDHVLDLFCGIGNFSLPIAKHCANVTGVDGDAQSISQAKANAKLNNIDNCNFYHANLFDDIQAYPFSAKKYDKILLDPPRSGAKEIIPLFQKWQPQSIVYVSCNPTTLARDLQELLKLGYDLQDIGVMDMFPHTQHIEAICLLERR